MFLKDNETSWDIADIIKVKLYKKGLDLKSLDLKDPILIQGFSGIGNVGLIAVRHMLTVAKGASSFRSYEFGYAFGGLCSGWHVYGLV